jgi:hypothetical protein
MSSASNSTVVPRQSAGRWQGWTAPEDTGVSNVSVMDHYLQLDMAGGAGRPMMVGYTTLGFLAAHTAVGHRSRWSAHSVCPSAGVRAAFGP